MRIGVADVHVSAWFPGLRRTMDSMATDSISGVESVVVTPAEHCGRGRKLLHELSAGRRPLPWGSHP